MKNLSDTGSYTFLDHVISRSVYSLSRLIGVKTVLKPFWNRWRAMGVPEETLQQFLESIDGLANWPDAATPIVAQLVDEPIPADRQAQIDHHRRICAVASLAQWGCLALDERKAALYRTSRDSYAAAETLAFGDRYRRLPIPWGEATLWGNLHLPAGGIGPAIILVHGMDDTKEEHLATELFLVDRGFAVLSVDGPGQGEALILDRLFWTADFHHWIGAAIDALGEVLGEHASAVGVVGVSWGGFWIHRAAAAEPRIAALYDLGGPIDTSDFSRLPFHLKSKFCQVFGVSNPDEVVAHDRLFSLREGFDWKATDAPIRIMHGARDPIVSVRDKEWLRDQMLAGIPDRDVTLIVEPTGDHCCTGHADAVRADAAAFFTRTLSRALPSNQLIRGEVS